MAFQRGADRLGGRPPPKVFRDGKGLDIVPESFLARLLERRSYEGTRPMARHLPRQDNDDLCSHCSCDPAYITFPPQMDCPWCGCGWLFTCTRCRKAFTFARGVEVDESWQQLPSAIWSVGGRYAGGQDLRDWIAAMQELWPTWRSASSTSPRRSDYPDRCQGRPFRGWHSSTTSTSCLRSPRWTIYSVVENILSNPDYCGPERFPVTTGSGRPGLSTGRRRMGKHRATMVCTCWNGRKGHTCWPSRSEYRGQATASSLFIAILARHQHRPVPAACRRTPIVPRSSRSGRSRTSTTSVLLARPGPQAARRSRFRRYGWEPGISDEELLERLLALNLERAGAQG